MKTSFLFPNSFKKVGWFLLIPATILGLLVVLTDYQNPYLNLKVLALFQDNGFLDTGFLKGKEAEGLILRDNFTNELAGILFLIGALLVGFSKEKQEDEYITKIRLESLVWATYLNYGFLLFGLIFVYGLPFLTFMIFNMFTVLIFFIIRFHFSLSQNNYSLKAHAE